MGEISGEYRRKFLEYIKNSAGGATKENFIEDYEPVGQLVWSDLVEQRLVRIQNDKIYLTAKGKEITG